MNITLGQVVYSKAGRDAEKVFLVVEIADNGYVFISDGDLRRIEKPKKKKVRHLEVTEKLNTALSQKLENKIKVTNAEIRKALADVGIKRKAIHEGNA